MKLLYRGTALFLLAGLIMSFSGESDASLLQYGRQYYGGWSYYPSRSYHYCYYHYRPTPTYPSYKYHICICYPSQPRYVYYYNPHSMVYWGRFDTQGKDGKQYSLLAMKDRKANLDDIPESAFPTPAAMPRVPEASDDVAIAPIKELPKIEKK